MARVRRDEGAVLIVFVITIGMLLAFGALVLGGSLAYTAERDAQTSADAAALAATARLRQVWIGEATADQVATTAADVAADNGADSSTCEIVTGAYALAPSAAEVIGPCDGTNELDVDAAGVRVTVTDRRDVPFGAIAGVETVEARTRATATAQPVRFGRAPLMVCVTADGHDEPPMVEAPAQDPPWEINDTAIGVEYVLHGNAMKEDGRQCGGTSSSWRGLVEFGQSFPVPGWWSIKTGNSNGQLPNQLAGGGCSLSEDGSESVEDFALGCRLAIPMCTTSNFDNGSGLELYCERMGVFEITYVNNTPAGVAPCLPSDPNPPNNLICGQFVGGGTAMSGQGGSSSPQNQELVIINLVE